ncbi:cadmium-translocating P-type ATPase [Paenibacillus sp. F411]|uniref:P-type Cu(+) transporter n=1 Tax=Paenibacillus algicola TaxID=2565926 RepID=A0A4V1G4D2_9BACL|nr:MULTISPECIES: heavy metal translocating P-type ATPase [Paenibacillus]MBO2945562.1 cadmium-translocating P-type ATPase [Paenibacillus sp. F411]QCT04284.1 heavy metal translocating P-type ATPase [Paenibacillus algicola]
MEWTQSRGARTQSLAHRQEGPERPNSGGKWDLASLLRNPEVLAALGSGVLMLTAWAVSSWSEWISVILYVISYTVGGWIKAKEGVETLIKERDLDVNLLMIAAALGAAAIGYWNEGAMLIFIFAMSGALESYTMERSRKDISSLMELQPETALRLEGGSMVEVAVGKLEIGDLILVKPGELIPADGKVYRGGSSVNQSSITGESVPLEKSVGDEVFAGTLNGEGVLYIEVTQSAEATVFAKIVKLVEEAENEVPQSERFIKRFEAIYARVVVGVTAGILALAPLAGWDWDTSFYKAMVFLVVASPCALVSSIMPAMLSAISNRARKGVLFKGGAHIENMAKTSVVAFDKTGTLTMGSPVVTDFVAGSGMSREELLGISASVESMSKHPLAQAVVAKASAEGIALQPVENAESITGWGMQGTVQGTAWRIGKSDVLDGDALTLDAHSVRNGEPDWRELRRSLEEEGKTVSVILRDGQMAGMIGLQDAVRPQAAAAVKRLQSMGIRVAMLTGDRKATADAIARQIGVDLVFSDLLPEDKVKHVRALREQHGHVVMVGDGVNDAPALATATVGIGMGISGSGTALEVSDAVLMNDNIEEIASTVKIARRAAAIVKQNMVFAVTVILTLISANFIQGVALPLGVIGHEGSTILVILNGLRLLRAK